MGFLDTLIKKTNGKNIELLEQRFRLNKRIEEFIIWYTEEVVKGKYTDIGECYEANFMLNFIEKMAVWYELRYPEFEITREFPGCGQENRSTKNYLNNIKNLKELLEIANEDEKQKIVEAFALVNWEDILSTRQFFAHLPWDEKRFFTPSYPDFIWFDNMNKHLHVSKKGYVLDYDPTEFSEIDKNLLDGNVKTVCLNLQQIGYTESQVMELISSYTHYEMKLELKQNLLNAVMYRIIERGGNRIGPHRAFKFAKEFNLDISIPFIYGIDYSDPGLRDFINMGLKEGLSTETMCIANYFFSISHKEDFKFISIEDCLKFGWIGKPNNRTEEEKLLIQRLVNVIANKAENEIPVLSEEEQTKQLRLERKIQASKAQRN